MDDSASLASVEIAERSLAAAERCGGSLDAVVVDLQDPSWGLGSRKAAIEQTEQAVRAFQAVTAQVGAVMLLTTRLSRRPEHRRDSYPHLTDMRQRDLPLLRAADVVLLLYRDDIYNLRSDQKGLVQVIVAKNRFGQEGSVLLRHEFQYGRFCDHPHSDEPRLRPAHAARR